MTSFYIVTSYYTKRTKECFPMARPNFISVLNIAEDYTFNMIYSCLFNKNREWKYLCLVVSHLRTYIVLHDSDSTRNYSEVDIKEMLGFLIDNIFVVFGNNVFKQTVGIPMGTNCAPLFVFVSGLILIFLSSRVHSKSSTWEEHISCCDL
jgi:hypothetical protein